MRTPRRLAALVLALSAGTTLAACSSPVSGTATPVSQAAEVSTEPAAPTVEEAGDTDPAPSPAPDTGAGTGTTGGGTTGSDTTGEDDLPVPGDGVPGDAGLCTAVAGWYGYAGLSLISVDDTGYVDPAVVVPLLEAMRDAPADHQDASAPLLAAAADVSAATDEVIGELESGTDVFTAFDGLTQPITDFGTACAAAGVSV